MYLHLNSLHFSPPLTFPFPSPLLPSPPPPPSPSPPLSSPLSSHPSPSPPLPSRWTSSQPFSMPSNEPGAVSLKGLIMLSSNEECLSKLIQYVSLPPFSSRLVALARSPRSSFGMLANIAILIQNIYEVSVLCVYIKVSISINFIINNGFAHKRYFKS